MNCASCGQANPEAARFCNSCGNPLVPRCSACGADNPPAARFCNACGAALAASSPKSEVRKIVTIVFADLIGSTALHERLDPESVSRFMDDYYRVVRAPVEAHGGTVVQLLGDGVMCAFGVPHVTEDDAIRAVRAAFGMQQAFPEFARMRREQAGRIGLRVAVNTGEVVVSDEHAAGIGDPLNVAARLQQEARDGDVLIGQSTERLVRDRVTLERFGTFNLKGRAESVTAYRVVSLDRPAGVPATPFVGRDDELRRLMMVYEGAVAAPGARLAAILGSPGLGKSRLLAEVARRLEDQATVLTARCDAAGGATFAPLAQALRKLLRIEDGTGGEGVRTAIDAALRYDTPSAVSTPQADAERTRIADGVALLLAGTPAPPEETFFVVRRFLTGLAARHSTSALHGKRPVVLAIDDLQWAEPLLLDFTEHLVQWTSGVPLLVLVAARPEVRETRSSLTTPGGLVAEVVTLAGLDADAATRLAANTIGAGALPSAIAGRVLATSEGNPLFVGELVRMLVQDGVLKREGNRWTAAVAVAELEMPPTIQALLAARIERLRPEERAVLERAAVVGRQFSRSAVCHLLPREAQSDVDARLEALRRSELIEPDAGWLLGEPALRFHHGLTRDAAYRRVLKGTRAELHGRCADWIESRAGEAIEYDETIGWHLEQAHQHLRELGPLDAAARKLGERAARYLAAAGRRALARDDLAPAASLLGRALDRLDGGDPARAELALDWCEALLAAGDVGPAAKAIAELGRFTGADNQTDRTDRSDLSDPPTARLRAWHTCFSGQHAVLTDPQTLRATADAVAAAAAALAAVDDAAGEAKAHAVHASALVRLGEVGACEAALDRALAAARRANDRRRSNAVLAGAPQAALWGPSPVTRASGRCLDVVRVLRITQGAPAVEAVALRCQAVLEALRGRTEAARRMIASSRRMVEELGVTHQLLEADAAAGLIALLEGDEAAAERNLRTAYEGLRGQGLGIDAARAGALLGRALLAQDRAAEAEALSCEVEVLAGDDLKAAIAWRGVRAEALAKRGEAGAAVELARAAVDIAATTDALLDHADARVALATALHAAGKSDEAVVEEARAIELWDAKGATLLAERARHKGSHAAGDVAAGQARPLPSTPPGTPKKPLRRVVPNAATAGAERLRAAAIARDAEALEAVFASNYEVVEHTAHITFALQQQLEDWQAFFATKHSTYVHESVASLGRFLAVNRRSWSGDSAGRYPGGAFAPTYVTGETYDVANWEIENIALLEVDTENRLCRAEVFAVDYLGNAVARMYERYAELLPAGPQRERAAATARAVAMWTSTSFILDSITACLAPDVHFVDHRRLGFEAMHGRDAIGSLLQSLTQTVGDSMLRVDDVLAVRPDAYLSRMTNSGMQFDGGGAFERQFLCLTTFGSAGQIEHIDLFDSDCEAEALARLDDLVAPTHDARAKEALKTLPIATDDPEYDALARIDEIVEGSSRRTLTVSAIIDSTAARSSRRISEPWNSGDWEGYAAFYRADFRLIDRRSLIHLELGRDEYLKGARLTWDMRSSRLTSEVIATRGDRLVLQRTRQEVADTDVGPSEREYLVILEVDEHGNQKAMVLYDSADVDAAYAELDRRYLTGEAAPYGQPWAARLRHVMQAITARDWDGLASMQMPDLVVHDHRPIGWGVLSGDEWITLIRALTQLRPDAIIRHDHVLGINERGNLFVTHWAGDEAGGQFEIPSISVTTLSADGRQQRIDVYGLDQIDEARTRFAELTAQRAALRIENTATRSIEQMTAAWAARDRGHIEALFAPDYRQSDRRRLALLDLDREQSLEALRPLLQMRTSRLSAQVLATRGDRLALGRTRVEFADNDVGLSEGEVLTVSEVDEHGARVRNIIFDADELDAAYAELDQRYAEGEAAPYRAEWERNRQVLRAIAAQDWERLAFLAGDFTLEDHRPLGLGTRSGGEAIAVIRAMVELRPDAVLRWDHVLAISDSGTLFASHWTGDEARGQFEIPSIGLGTRSADGRFQRWDIYDWTQLAEARAHFGKLTQQPATFRIENAATRSMLRMEAAWVAHDWEGIAVLYAPNFRQSDRRRLILLELDRQQALDSQRAAFSMPASRLTSEVLATRGDRLAMARARVEVADADLGPSEREVLSIVEVDERGERVRDILFDPDALDDAYAELDQRYAAINAENAADGGHAAPRLGLQADAGDPLAAFARPNAATVAMDRVQAAFVARDWDAMRAACTTDARIEDRRRHSLMSEGIEGWIAELKRRGDANVYYERRLQSAPGRLIAIERISWRSSASDAPIEGHLWLTEVDESGRILAGIAFDLHDWRAADRELNARWFAADPTVAHTHAPGVEMTEAFNEKDRARLRAMLADALVVHDHRPARLGVVEGADAYVEMAAAWWDLAPDVQLCQPHLLARERHGQIAVTRAFGTLREGGAFEVLMVGVAILEAGRYVRLEIFDIEEADRALARFAELCAERDLRSK